MISQRLKYIFAASIPVFILHGIEEYLTGFYNLDKWDEWIFGLLPFTSIHQATFASFQVMLWLLLIVSFLLILNERWRLYLMSFFGFIYILELHHIYKALVIGGYYPGLITALLFPVVGYFYWRELVKLYKINQ